MDDDLRARRLRVIEEHFASETEQRFEDTLETFGGHPHYEIFATGEVYDGAEEVMGYYRATRTAFPDQRHEDVHLHVAEDAVVAEFTLVGTNLGPFLGREPTGRGFRVPVVALFFFEGDGIVNERIYFDTRSLLVQTGHDELLVRGNR
jgi:steroid delta-isomerase-like uncharacterized protein